MKRVGIFVLLIMLSVICVAQIRKIEEVVVKAPKYNGVVTFEKGSENFVSPISRFLQKDLSIKSKEYDYLKEGTVIIDFTVNTDGTVDNFIVKNSISHTNDNFVISALKSTSGDWIPGQRDGFPVEMEKRVVVAFTSEETPSLNHQARYYTVRGIKKFMAAERCQKNLFIHQENKEKRTERKLCAALKRLESANSLRPNEPCVKFWEAKTYEKLGDDIMRYQKLNEYQDALDARYYAMTDLVTITL
ncbi:energy transducer TonB [Plebeiibacterium marinum]|uniref:TonB C-terminal domain-containing protein n=1 Tax=Plebeiibacterium marinum TaxID=2992111 RepID=A0AAE3MEZ9_9BACT|nr:hypothetical protein [Plebeiobacterium marinum]MCW3806501.1 hypothetical protein [Plebeiobacterium marinum]